MEIDAQEPSDPHRNPQADFHILFNRGIEAAGSNSPLNLQAEA
jgi:hypothetical protein